MSGLALLGVWAALWAANVRVARSAIGSWAAPLLFGLTLLILWEMATRLFDIPAVILPAPTSIAVALTQNAETLRGDWIQTVFKGAFGGWLMGCAAGIATALLVARSDFLRRGLLPVGNFVAALPIVGTAPILVMWFGFGWESKAAVVVVMVFFPVLVNTVAGLADTTAMQRDLMRTYGAAPRQELRYLKAVAALPFIFNGLKIATTLALIGAIVAEFFGSPTYGIGFRISTEVGRLNLPVVWAAIVVAAITGSLWYGAIALLEKRLTFWHPSQRGRA
ncbi:NitT/TauT family transport system permease protein [Jannaschia faecimaris]|uniref:NitT/TauT family transport system permease protein n=1 Tax=Jannaschia faecimaris TaxID=1244108 RepID=A0A1H3RBD1_9RHOB|nr:ABC transporter permease [Jannaschia faecimaris]SDZ23064.1 NitT/TauT family transport system permease protein [Jannaschia faecimaris]